MESQTIKMSDPHSTIGVVLNFNIEDFSQYAGHVREIRMNQTARDITELVTKLKEESGFERDKYLYDEIQKESPTGNTNN